MKTIYKYPLKITDDQDIEMPFGATILTAQVQDNRLCLWAEVESKNSPEKRRIEIIGTGNPIEEIMGLSRLYIGTAVMPPFVWHVYELL